MDWGAQGREAFVIESGATNRTPRSRSSSWLRPTRPPTAGSCLINSASPMQNASCMLLTSSASSTTSMLSLTAQMPFVQRTHAWWHIRNQPHPPLHSGIRVICGPHWVGKLPVRPANKLLLEGDIQTHTMERRSCDQSGRLLRVSDLRSTRSSKSDRHQQDLSDPLLWTFRTSKVFVVGSSLFPFATNTYEIMIRRHPNEARLQPHDEPLRARRPFQRDRIDLLFSPENNGWQSSSTSSLLHHTPRIPRIYKECSGDFFFFF